MSDDNSSFNTEIITKASADAPSIIGETLDGRYLIESELTDDGADSGGIGLVYLASDIKLMGRKAVVKILQTASRDNEDIRRKFEHEKEALIRLKHPNIVDIQGIGELPDGNPYVVMEYISGYSLRKLLRDEGKLPLDLAAHITESVGNALGAAHDQKILHRDIKPENIMLTPQSGSYDHVKLIDFGIARVEEAQLAPVTTVPGSMGTPRYMAPEQLRGSLVQSAAIDVYSLSLVAYEMLTGELPYRAARTANELAELQRSGPERKPSDLRKDLPASVDSLIMSGLSYEPDQRPQDPRDMGRELAKLLRSVPAEPATAPVPMDSDATQHVVDTLGTRSVVTEARVPISEPRALKDLDAPLPARRKSKAPLWAGLGLLVLAAIAIPAGIAYWNGRTDPPPSPSVVNSNTNPAASAEAKRLTYHLDVQKMLNGQPVGQTFRSTGEEIYQNGQKFRMALTAPADGFLYVFAEGKDAKGARTFSIIFPTPKTNNGTAAVARDQAVETGFNTFSGTAADEVLWAIWTKDQNPDLEAARTSAFANAGEVDSAGSSKIKEFLDKTPASKKDDVKADPDRSETTVKTQADSLIHKIILQHK